MFDNLTIKTYKAIILTPWQKAKHEGKSVIFMKSVDDVGLTYLFSCIPKNLNIYIQPTSIIELLWYYWY